MRFFVPKLFWIFSFMLFLTTTPPVQAQNPPPQYECDQLYHAGRGLSHQKLYPEALEQIRQAYDCYRDVGYREGEAATLIYMGGIYGNIGQYQQALDYYQQALNYYQEAGDQQREGMVFNQIALIYDDWKQYEQALKYYQQSLTIYQVFGNSIMEGDILDRIAMIYVRLGEYEQALAYYQQGLPIYQSDKIRFVLSLYHIGTVYDYLGQYEQALNFYQQSLDAMQSSQADRSLAQFPLRDIGIIHAHLGQYEQALEYFQQSLNIQKDIGDRKNEEITHNHIGGIYEKLGQYEQALHHYRQILAISQEVSDKENEGISLQLIGNIYYRLGRYEQALDFYRQSLTISQEIDSKEYEGIAFGSIGVVYQKLGQHEQALDNFQQGLSIFQKNNDRDQEGTILTYIAGIYHDSEQYNQAIKYYQQSLSIFKATGNREGEGHTLKNIGQLYNKSGQYEQALDYLKQSLAIWQGIGDRISEGTTLGVIGDTYANLEQYEQALDYYQQAMEVLENVRTQAGSEQGRSDFIEQYVFLYSQMIDLFYKKNNNDQAFLITERGRARAFLDSMVTGQVRLSDNDAANLLAQERERYAHLIQITRAWFEVWTAIPHDPEIEADLEVQVEEAEREYKLIREAVAAHGSELASLVPGRSADYVLGVEKIQPMLDKKTTLISYFVLDDKTLAFLVTRDDFHVIPLEVSREQLTNQITAFHDFSNVDVVYPDSTVTLYQWLIEPLKPHLKTPHLAIIPHNVLHYLPFAALTDGERYLIDDYTLTVLPSASALPFIQKNAKQTTVSRSLTALILGNPVTADYDTVASLATSRDQLGSLPFAEKEAKAIAALFGVESLIGEVATESAVREQVPQANILHLAAHGLFNPVAPLNSLIALAPDSVNNSPSTIDNSQLTDGWLTVGEIYGLDLKKTDLVVLSACETNLGDLSAGDELVGLTRAFIFAGTPSVIASLWQVDDESTAMLMERFYTHLKDGIGKAEALRQAQIEVREKYPNPYHWAAFVLSGDGE